MDVCSRATSCFNKNKVCYEKQQRTNNSWALMALMELEVQYSKKFEKQNVLTPSTRGQYRRQNKIQFCKNGGDQKTLGSSGHLMSKQRGGMLLFICFNYSFVVSGQTPWINSLFLVWTSRDMFYYEDPATIWEEGSVATIAGSGNPEFKDGKGANASFNLPFGVGVDPSGRILVTDEFNHCVRRIGSRGAVSTFAGNRSGSQAEFKQPSGVTVAEDGVVHVADNGNHRIRQITSQGEVSTVAGNGSANFKDGPCAAACFCFPKGLALKGPGSIIVADSANHCIRQVSTQGVTTMAGSGEEGSEDGTALNASFKCPLAVAVGPNGHVMATDDNGRLCLISKDVSTVATDLHGACGLLVDCRGNAIVADTVNHRIIFCTPQGKMNVIAGDGKQAFKDGPSDKASFNHPRGLALDHEGRVVVADSGNHRVRALTLPSTLRLQEELNHIQSDSPLPKGCSVTRSATSLFKWSAVLQVAEGPFPEGPFLGQSFELSLEMPFDYPMSGPLVKLVHPLLGHPNVDSETGEVEYFEWGSAYYANNPILEVLDTVLKLLSGEWFHGQVLQAEQKLAAVGARRMFEKKKVYDKRMAGPQAALDAARAELAAFMKATETTDGSVGFWSRKLKGVLNPRDIPGAAFSLSGAKFRQRHWGGLGRNELQPLGLEPGVIMDLIEHQARDAAAAVAPASLLPPVVVHTSAPSTFLKQYPGLPRISENDLEIGWMLGTGSYSMVRRAVWTRAITVGRQGVSKVPVAVKMARVLDADDKKWSLLSADMARDLAVISDLPHQNILNVHGVCEAFLVGFKTATVKIVYELMSTDLAKLLKRCERGRLPTKMLLRVLRDVSAGLAHLHHNKVLHGDVKPANVLLRRGGVDEQQQPEEKGNEPCFTNKELQEFEQVKLCDFGSSKDLQQSLQQMSYRGTPDYMAPEMKEHGLVGQAADVWSFGVVLFECATGNVCESKTSPAKLKAELAQAGCGEELWEIFEQCHQIDQEQRPKMEAIYEQLQVLVVKSIHDNHALRQELKRAEAQDKEAYDKAWKENYALQQGMPGLLPYVAQVAREKPAKRVVRQPLLGNGGKGSWEELELLGSADAANRLHALMRALVENRNYVENGGVNNSGAQNQSGASTVANDEKMENNAAHNQSGGETVENGVEASGAQKQTGGGTYIRDRKSEKSSVRKATKDYKEDYSLLLDLERATGLFNEASEMLQCLQRLLQAEQQGLFTILRCKDKLNHPLPSGYRDVLLNICDERGFVVELQLNFHKIAEIKSHAHRIYELTRVLELEWVL